MAVMYLLSAVGVTVGFHRLLTHRAFQTYPWLERIFAILGSLSVQGSVLDWVADHRKHHAHADQEGDPHSPHVGHGSGLRGLWHAHVGWLLETQGQADWKKYAPELYEDPKMRRIGRRFPLMVVLSLLIPDGRRLRAVRLHRGRRAARLRLGRPRADLLRASHHVVGDSVCHFFGRRRFDVADQSTNVGWLALFSLGESWHHNHACVSALGLPGPRWWEVDARA